MDYRRFLAQKEERRWPHFGGAFVYVKGRRYRLPEALAPGWWTFSLESRSAKAIGPAEPDSEAIASLPATRGHLLGDLIVREGARAEPIFFLPADQPPRFAAIRARRWTEGQLLFDALEFESDAEDAARRALEDQRSIGGLRGIPATLRAAFGYAVAFEVGRRLEIPVSPAEVVGSVVDIAGSADPRAAADGVLRRLAAERIAYERTARLRGLVKEAAQAAASAPEPRDVEERAAAALGAADATLLDSRKLDGGLLEVTYRFMGERFLTIVHASTLQVIDAGICLAGHDDDLTLESLPSALKEAIDRGHLVITRRDANDPRGRYHWERDLVDD